MDGRTLTRLLAEILNEDPDTSLFAPEQSRTSYDLLYQAALEFNNRTSFLRDSQDITTVADTDAYTLDADFQELYLKNNDEYYVQYIDGSSNVTTMYYKPEEDAVYENNTSSIDVPGYFYIKHKALTTTTRTSTATSDGAATGGQCTLTDSAATFVTWDVWPGDTVHNTTDGSTGYVLSVSSETACVVALFDGTSNDWTNNDAYTLVHQPRLQLVCDQPPSTASETIRVRFVKRPDPVYSDYGRYDYPYQYARLLPYYAAWLHKYRDRDPNFGDAWYGIWERGINQSNKVLRDAMNRSGFKVIMKKR